MALATVVYRLVTDETFRALFKADPDRALAAAGLRLSLQEVVALNSLPWNDPALDWLPDNLIGPNVPDWGGCRLDPCPTRLKLSTTG